MREGTTKVGRNTEIYGKDINVEGQSRVVGSRTGTYGVNRWINGRPTGVHYRLNIELELLRFQLEDKKGWGVFFLTK